MVKVVLPDYDEQIEGATIAYWSFEEGDPIEKGEILAEVTGDDSESYKVPATVSGILTEIYFEEGDDVEVGELLAEIEEE
ncbi:MAG: biotin/lipoyl-containing protein [Candidatus Ancaeobacter aquaticus]|nr:biotin/lipoyl-containing protein [Candidatus Ancaeobacter aquaticus]